MTIDRFLLWQCAAVTGFTVVINLVLIRYRHDSLNTLRAARAFVAFPLFVIYTLGCFSVIDGRLNIVAARATIIPVFLVGHIIPSFFHGTIETKPVALSEEELRRLEQAAERVFIR